MRNKAAHKNASVSSSILPWSTPDKQKLKQHTPAANHFSRSETTVIEEVVVFSYPDINRISQQIISDRIPQQIISDRISQQIISDRIPQQIISDRIPQQIISDRISQQIISDRIP